MKRMAVCLALLSASMAHGRSAADLRADNRKNPLGIDRFPVMLSWRMEDGISQKAYRIEAVNEQGQSVWTTGKVMDDRSHQIPYGGPALNPGERIHWRVMLWDESGKAGEWSEPAWFEAGLLDDANWGDAEWITDTRNYQAPQMAPAELMGPWMGGAANSMADRFFLEFTLEDKPVVSAKAYSYLPGNANGRVLKVNEDRMNKDQLAIRQRPWKRPNGMVDFATDLVSGEVNQIKLEMEKPVEAANFSMMIIFADGSEQLIESGSDWQVSLNGKPLGAAKVLEKYGGPRFGRVHLYAQTGFGPSWLRRGIDVKPNLTRARLYLCALGQGLAYVNGEMVDDIFFPSPQSDYEEFAYYTVHDIGRFLKPGKNALSVLLDSSWYHQVGGFQFILSYGSPGLKAKIVLEYEDGSTETVVSNGQEWQWRKSETTLANIYLGEIVDYRLDHDEWKQPSGGTGWQPVRTIAPLTPKTVAVDVTPVRRDGELNPVASWQVGPETWLFDMGETIHGVICLAFNEPAGSVIHTRYAEHADDGMIRNVPLSQWMCHGVMQRDEIISDGTPRVFQNRFTTKSFRFVEISGLSKKPEPGELKAFKVHTEAEVLSTFESSDSMLNRLYDNGIRTFENYVNHVSGDMPRERCLWGLESVYSFQTAAYCFDWKNNQRLMDTLWWTGRKTPEGIPGNIGVGLRLTERTQSFLWSATPMFSMSNLLDFYEDAEPAAHFYDEAKAFVTYFEENAVDGVYPEPYSLSDHAAPLEIKRGPLDQRLLNAMGFFDVQNRMARMADALGKKEDAAHARAYAEKIRAAIMKQYDRENHTFGIGTHDSIALAYGVLTDPEEEKLLARSLVNTYRANGHKFDGGFMSYEIYPMLAKYGYVEDAYWMLVNDDYPGPAWSVTTYDATTYYERYWRNRVQHEKVGQNFWAFAHPTGWMIADLVGIRYAAPHGREMKLAPKVPRSGKLSHVASSLKTPTGLVKSAWTYNDEIFNWSFTVPPNATAEVSIPADELGSIQGAEKLRLLREEGGVAVYKAFTGTYSIQSRMTEHKPVVNKEAEAQRPNIVLIMTDDMGYSELGCYGSPDIKTPMVDQLAREGMRFTDFYVASSVCSASRAALLTGSYPTRVGVPGVFFPNQGCRGLDPKHITSAELPKTAGYATKAVGKWHLGDEIEFLPTNQGFDSYYGIPYSNDMYPAKSMKYAKDCLFREDVTLDAINKAFAMNTNDAGRPKDFKDKVPLMRDNECIEVPVDQSTITRRYADEAIQFIAESVKAQKPFFLYLANSMPHTPLFASPEFSGKSERGLYGDVIEEIDFHTGRMLDQLKLLGIEENTIVIFTSDNGPWLIKEEDGGCALPLFEGKMTRFEGGQRVPAIVRWPGHIPAGSTCTEIATSMDLLPTLVNVAGATLPAKHVIDGKDIMDLLSAKEGAKNPHHSYFYGTLAVRSGDWKYHRREIFKVKATERKTKGSTLYNIKDDIGERVNRIREHPEIAERLRRELAEFVREQDERKNSGKTDQPIQGKVH